MIFTTAELARQLESELGTAAVTDEPSALAAHQVDGKRPVLICTPATPDELAAAMRICSQAEAALVPWGGGTAMAMGNPPRRADVVLKTHRLSQVIDHDHANLTVTVQSGFTIHALQAVLAPEKQYLPFDPPSPHQSTVGGIIAANLNGPRRSTCGSVRDLVIGMKVVLGTGEQIKAGGKVVKNVAGYDMCKLFTGSLGTLGIITEATVRLAPIPQSRATVIATGALSQALQLADGLADSKLLPSAVFLRKNTPAQDWQLIVGFAGFEQTIARQVRDLDTMTQRLAIRAESLRADREQRIWQEIGDLPLVPDQLVYRLTVPRKSAAQVIFALQSWRPGLQIKTIMVDMVVGAIWAACEANKKAVTYFPRLTSLAQGAHGHAVILSAPAELKSGIEVWGPTPPPFSLMSELKQRFDPKAMLNPGRFIGGL